jgi:hypothetical protein
MFLIERFLALVEKETRGQLGHVVIIYDDSGRHGKWPMHDADFRKKVLDACSRRGSPVVCARFAAPNSYDDQFQFSAYRRPLVYHPGHCIICNHAHIRNNRCENISCNADQTYAIRMWLSTPQSVRTASGNGCGGVVASASSHEGQRLCLMLKFVFSVK